MLKHRKYDIIDKKVDPNMHLRKCIQIEKVKLRIKKNNFQL
mgnify:CR=1 FL=1